MRTILLTGRTGQVGWELQETLRPLGRVVAPAHEEMDLTSADSIRKLVREIAPDVIVNAAGFTVVDEAEAEPERAMQINGIAPGVMAEEAKRAGALLLHYSSTFVFDGMKTAPYVESDMPSPINAYGRSKLAGEQAITASGCDHVILRANWTYSARRTNFVLTMLRLAQEEDELAIVRDQIGSPTWARDYASATAALLSSDEARSRGGIYHLSASGLASRLEFARIIIEWASIHLSSRPNRVHIREIAMAQYPLRAARPSFSVTDNTRIQETFGIVIPEWKERLRVFFEQLALQDARFAGSA